MEQDDRMMIRKSVLAEHLTCHICLKLFKEATTISECLHTFCKDCIYGVFEDDTIQSCPKCNKFLGACPQRTLRPDHQLQNLRNKLLSKPTTSRALGKNDEVKTNGNGKSVKRQKIEEGIENQIKSGGRSTNESSATSSSPYSAMAIKRDARRIR